MTIKRAATAVELSAVCRVLGSQHIPVTADVDQAGVTHIHPLAPLTTLAEVTALRAFAAITDACQYDQPGMEGYR